jgi:hydroxymethylpyrimidine pyrophosphatase-like HAD family hydrolase
MDDAKTIHKYNLKVFDEFVKNGNVLCICTGRPFRRAKAIYNDLGLDTIIGVYNGGRILHPNEDKSYEEKHALIEKDIINRVLNSPYLDESIINFVIEFKDRGYKQNGDGLLLPSLDKGGDVKIKTIKRDEDGKFKIYTDPFAMLIDVKGARNTTGLFNNLVNEFGEELFIRF